MEYNFTEVEKKWQAYWKEHKTFETKNNFSLPKYYVLDMFPYPSGAGLHVGHPLGYIASDIIARYKRHKGFNVLHPMGYDSFGLPAEQYAIETGQHPAITTEKNIARYREQLDKIGFSFDWDREVRTSDPNYYKWTQWIFIQLFNSWYNKKTDKAENISSLIAVFESEGNSNIHAACDETKNFTASEWKSFSKKEQSDILLNYRLTYLSDTWVNWCPQLGTVLANEEVKDGVSERGGFPVERKLMKQWSMRITAYAERLLNGLETIDWSESIKEAQRNWIGKSEGTSLRFEIIQNKDLSPALSEGKGDVPAYHTTDPKMWNLLQDKALAMRDKPTEAENALWKSLKGNKLDEHFRRQQIIDKFIVDFVCLSKKLVIEVDGDIHDYQKEEDAARTEKLNELGFKVIRFKNEQVLGAIESVLTEIKSQLDKQSLNKKVLPFGEDLGGVPFLEVFTTRPDTIFGVSFVTLAPEHELVEKITTPEYKKAVDEYVTAAKKRSERERQADVKKISGQFTGAYVEHPFTGKSIPVWVGDYVLAGYGTGAVMAVPAHDARDFAFAKHFGLDIIKVVEPLTPLSFGEEQGAEAAYEAKDGKLINSDFLNGLDVKAAIKKAIAEIEENNFGKGKTNFRLRDAIFGRQRYWGEPIPVYYKDGIPHVISESELPLVLPEIDKFLPTETGEPPLARAKNWNYSPLLGRGAGGEVFPYEHSTMPGWAGSSWYFLRYMDVKNNTEFASKKAIDYWQNIDLYMGGAEHATGHLLYVRFWTKFLKDIGYFNFDEPAKKLINQGMIQGRSSFVYKILYSATSNVPLDGTTHIFINKTLPPIFLSNNLYQNLIDNNYINKEKAYGIINNILNTIPNKYFPEYSENIKCSYSDISVIRVDISIVDNDILNTEIFKTRYGYSNAEFIYEDDGVTYICGSEPEKMSKSKYNVVNPDDVCEKYGADCLRLYEMFLGPLEISKPWNTNGISGVSNFIRKLWRLYHKDDIFTISDEPATKPELKSLHKTIKKITEDIERFSFNTSVSNFMICVNELTELKCNKREILEPLAILISPYAPHIAEELWNLLGHSGSIAYAKFPEFDEKQFTETSFNYPVSVNGKTRFFTELELSLTKEDIEKEVMAMEQTQKYLEGKSPKKIIIVPNKIVNIVI